MSPMTLAEALERRRSTRDFYPAPLSAEQQAHLLWAAQGTTGTGTEQGRTSPSAGALYPLEIYAVTPEGVFHYIPDGHRVMLHARGDKRSDLCAAALGQKVICLAPFTMAISAVFERTFQKYGAERGSRYVYLEAGHAAQNVLLAATALGLGGVGIGAFTDDKVRQVLELPMDHMPLYLIALGKPRP